MKDHIKEIIIAVVVIIAIIGWVVVSINKPKEIIIEKEVVKIEESKWTSSEKAEMKMQYVRECVDGELNYYEYCKCTFDTTVEKYGFDEIINWGVMVNSVGELPNTANEAVSYCIHLIQ